jgi:L-ascorbate metabolism protein UlaG (beta-lactamase superfamily)
MRGWAGLLRTGLAVLATALLLPSGQAWAAEAACSNDIAGHSLRMGGPGIGSPRIGSQRIGSQRIVPAAFTTTALAGGEIGLTFVGHSTFVIQSPAGVTIATDYNDFVRPREVPDIATMNHAHTTHYTDHPDPRIKYVLRGWDPAGGLAHHDLQYRDVRIRNVLTNIREGVESTEMGGNSIFVVETGGLCIAHLGHLHHTLTPEHLDQLGHIDVVLVPVDGSWTLDLDGMIEVLDQLKAPLVVPMHYFSPTGLKRFLDRVRERYTVTLNDSPSIVLSRAMLPAAPEVLVLPGN